MMVKNYEEDQAKLEYDIRESENILADVRETETNVNSWIRVISKYKEITELNADALNEFIEKILIHKPQKDENGNRIQKIDICYRFIGNIDQSTKNTITNDYPLFVHYAPNPAIPPVDLNGAFFAA